MLAWALVVLALGATKQAMANAAEAAKAAEDAQRDVDGDTAELAAMQDAVNDAADDAEKQSAENALENHAAVVAAKKAADGQHCRNKKSLRSNNSKSMRRQQRQRKFSLAKLNGDTMIRRAGCVAQPIRYHPRCRLPL